MFPYPEMSKRLFTMCVFSLLALAAAGAHRPNELPLTDGWTFSRDGGPFVGVRVPHDAAIAGPFDRSLDSPTGLLRYFGHGEYRRTLVRLRDAGKALFLEVDGAMHHARVLVNGTEAGGRPYGYSSFSVRIDPFLRDGTNELRVVVDAPEDSARWYPGFGLYRNVRLVEADARAHVAYNGVRVRTEGGDVKVEVEIEGERKDDAVWSARVVGESGLTVEKPRWWSPETPNLYEVEVVVKVDGKAVDSYRQRFGFRTLSFDPEKGFFLNGVHRQMKGVCLHHDLGPLGAALDVGALRRQLAIMKEMGADAIRTSHNPPAPELLDLCDEMGLMVMDEAFDVWEVPKRSKDYSLDFAAWHERDLTDLVKRDRNHPSVVMWSVGNEVKEHYEWREGLVAAGRRIGRELTEIVHRYDDRPVTLACFNAEAVTNGMAGTVDVFGANYLPEQYAAFRGRQGVIGSETCSMVSSRGEYFFPLGEGFADDPTPRPMARDGIRDHQVSSYDLYSFRANNYAPDVEFAFQERNPHVYGEFVWTGFDYLGGTDPWGEKGTPSKNSYYGIVDLCGFPKDRYYLYQAQWRPDLPMAHLLPHWTWPGRDGQVTPVHVYTSGDEAELFLNGRSAGRLKRRPFQYRFRWDGVVYEPGELKVVVWKGGHPWAEDVVRTAGSPVDVRAAKETWGDLDYWSFTALDDKGRISPVGSLRLEFTVRNGELAGVCNGDAADNDSFGGRSIRTFHGFCQAVVRRTDATVPELTWRVVKLDRKELK